MDSKTQKFILITLATYIEYVRKVTLETHKVCIRCCNSTSYSILLDALQEKTNARGDIGLINEPIIYITKGKND